MATLNRNQRLLATIEHRLTDLSREEPENVPPHELVDLLKAKKLCRMLMNGDELTEFDELMENPS